MTKTTISEFEDSIASAKKVFFESFKEMLALVKGANVADDLVQEKLTELHSNGLEYFNLFERSINEYGLKYFKSNQNIRNSKIDDAINISNTLIKYWNLLDSLNNKYDIIVPTPSERAYSSLQLFLQTFEKQKAKELKLKYIEAGLPIFGFESPRKFYDMTRKQQVTYGIIAGTIFLVALLAIGIIIDCPTNSQNRIFTTILALGAAAFSATIPGFIDVRYREIITASGAIAVFVIVFLLKPAELSDFKSCQENISGTVYFGNSPKESVELMFIKQNKSTRTDNFGSFNIPLDLSSVGDKLTIQLQDKEIQLDTVVSFKKSELSESIDIYIKKYCVHCTQKDSSDLTVNSKRICSASNKFISDYIEGFTKAGKEQGRVVECKRE